MTHAARPATNPMTPAVLRLNDRPANMADWMTNGGFSVVPSRQSGDRGAGYSDIVKKQHRSVFVNSSRSKANNFTLKTVKFVPYKNTNHNSGYHRNRNNQECVVFISRLYPKTTPQNVTLFLKPKYNKHFKVEQFLS